MLRFGKSPYLECSSRGDQRFSAFFARPRSLKGKSIEEAYQAMKIFEDGTSGLSWYAAKGKGPVNLKDCKVSYKNWWKEYITENDLLKILRKASGLSDIFGQQGHICQAEILWEIRGEK